MNMFTRLHFKSVYSSDENIRGWLEQSKVFEFITLALLVAFTNVIVLSYSYFLVIIGKTEHILTNFNIIINQSFKC